MRATVSQPTIGWSSSSRTLFNCRVTVTVTLASSGARVANATVSGIWRIDPDTTAVDLYSWFPRTIPRTALPAGVGTSTSQWISSIRRTGGTGTSCRFSLTSVTAPSAQLDTALSTLAVSSGRL